MGGGSSSAVLYRVISLIQGTVVHDESDMRFSDTYSPFIKILNNGHTREAGILKVGDWKKGNDIVCQDVFGPKVLATRHRFDDDALESRCLTIPMRPTTRKDIPLSLDEKSFENEALRLRNKFLSFRLSMIKKLKKKKMPYLQVDPRLQQIITPLYSFLESEEHKEALVSFAEGKQMEMLELRRNSVEGKILSVILELIEKNEPTIQLVTDTYNKRYKSKYALSSRNIGETVGNILCLEKKRTAQGYCIIHSEKNDALLEKLKSKFGFDECM